MQANDELTTIEKAWATLREEMVDTAEWSAIPEIRYFARSLVLKMDKLLEVVE